jgi:geranylgeranyl diphosphate synthase, type I
VDRPPAELVRLRAAVDAALEPALDDLRATLLSVDAELAPVAEALGAFAADGKRLRPALLLLGHELCGGDPGRVLGPAVALELVHTCALVHDDVIDRAATRRGEPTVHERFAAMHRARDGWRGDADDFGRAVAILLGDVALVAADAHFLTADVDPVALSAAYSRFTAMRVEVMAGQWLDLEAATSGRGGIERALTVATLKSGRYSVARPLEIGALLAGAGPVLADGLRDVGDPIGRAFQLRDDLLGVHGDPTVTGKPVGADLIEGKRTVLVAEALDRLGPADRATLDASLGDPGLDAASVARLQGLLESCGARAAVEARIDADLALADEALAALPLSPDARRRLSAIGAYLGRRDA